MGIRHGYVWAAVYNCRPRRWTDFDLAADRAMWEAFGQVEWPP